MLPATIPRDLKPPNILVSEVDGKPLPRIIAFGVAKATAQRLTDKTMFTRFGALVGTPEYMVRSRPIPPEPISIHAAMSIRSASCFMSC